MTKRLPYSATPSERFERMYQAVPLSGCWIWMGALDRDGYGSFFVKGRRFRAHRFAFEQSRGLVPADKELDHLCRVRCCVNPMHVEPVTHQVNMLRGDGVASENAAKTHCKNGHPFLGGNLAVRAGRRVCKACDVITSLAYQARRTA